MNCFFQKFLLRFARSRCALTSNVESTYRTNWRDRRERFPGWQRCGKNSGAGVRSVYLGIGAVLILGAAATGCDKKASAPLERPPAPVTVAAATTEDVPFYIDAVGRIVAREVVSVQPQVSGRVVKIQFADGADVKAGEVLFAIDARPFQAQLNQAEANLAEAQAALNLAKTNFARVENITDPRAVSRQDHDTKKNAVDIAEAQVRQNRAAVERARLDLEYCTIRAPIDGRAGQRLVDVGNIVSANNRALLVIQRLDPIYADFTVTEHDLSAVQRNMARRTLRVEVSLPDDSRRAAPRKPNFSRQRGARGQRHGETAGDHPQCRPSLLARALRQSAVGVGLPAASRARPGERPANVGYGVVRLRGQARLDSGVAAGQAWTAAR